MIEFPRRAVVILSIVIALLAVMTGRGHAQFVLYDNFAGSSIDQAKWLGFFNEGSRPDGITGGQTAESVRVVENGSLHLHMVSWGTDFSDTGTVRSRMGLNMRELGTPEGSGFITGLKARVTVHDADAQPCPNSTGTLARARAEVIGAFFNDGGSGGPGDRIGDILAVFDLEKARDGSTSISASLYRCRNAGCSSFLLVPNLPTENPVVFTTTWSPDTAVVVKLVWDKTNGRFKFAVNGAESKAITYLGVLPDGTPPVFDFKSVRVFHDAENCTAGPKRAMTDAFFDDIKVQRNP